MKVKSLKVNAFLNSIRNFLNIVFPLITFPYISRVLSVKGIGKYTFSNSIISYFLLISSLGISTYAVREGAKYRDNSYKISQFANEMLTINVFSALVSYVLLFICLLIFDKLHSYLACILIYSIEIPFSVISVDWLFTIYEDFTYITVRSLIFQILSIVLLFIFVRHSNDYLNYSAITVFSAVGSNFLNFCKAERDHHLRLNLHFNWKKHMKPILVLFAVNVASLIYVNSDITILGFMKNNYVVGIYSTSSRIYTIVKTVLSAMLVVTIPRLAMLYGKHRLLEYKKLLKKLANFLVIITLPAIVGLIALSKQVILIIAGKHFLASIASLRILTLAFIFSVFAWMLTDCVLVPSKKEKYVLRSTVISAILNIVFNLIFIPFLSDKAAAISTVLAELAVFLINYHYSKDIVKDIFLSKDLLRTLATAIIGCVAIVIVCLIVNNLCHSLIIMTVLSVSISVLVYGLVLIAFRNPYALALYNEIVKKLK